MTSYNIINVLLLLFEFMNGNYGICTSLWKTVFECNSLNADLWNSFKLICLTEYQWIVVMKIYSKIINIYVYTKFM